MKNFRKILLLITAFAVILCLLSACKGKKPDGGDSGAGGGDSTVSESIIFSDTVDVSFIRPKGEKLSLLTVKDKVYELTEKHVEEKEDDMPKATAEIVFGETSRSVSAKAMEQLALKLEKKKAELSAENEKTKYVEGALFYAEGDSLAVVWSDETVINSAIDYLVEKFMTAPTLKLKSGYSHFVSFDSLAIMAENEALVREEKYALVRDMYGAEVEAALRTHLGMFDERYYMWLADLYDPGEYDAEGNPLGGGFYFSNSGRDTLGFGIDLESTAQVLAFLMNSGMLSKDSDYMRLFPEKMQKEMVAFALNCQSPVDGYFYHPQWGTDVKTSRVARDCGWAVRILNYFGTIPYWNTPSGAEGLHGDPPGAEPVSALSVRLSSSSVSAVSKVLAASDTKSWRGSAQLKTLEAWDAYLDEITSEIRTKSYNIGNTVASQSAQILNREKIAKANGEKSGYVALFEEYFNKYQLSNGLWEECSVEDGDVYYNAINGLMKISGGYNSLGVKLNYAEEAMRAAAFMVTHIGISHDGSDWQDSKGKVPDGSVDVYNPWVCINNIFQNVRDYGDGEAAAKALRDSVVKPNALEMVKVTSRKIAMFSRDDGSYCYNWGPAGSTSQGAPVAVGGIMEGDVNGGNIAFTGTYREMANALGVGGLKPFGYSDFYKFVDRIEELGQVIKDDVIVDLDAGGFNFDEDIVGTTTPGDVTLTMNTGSVEVVADTREGVSGNVLRYETKNGAGSTMTYKPASVKNALGTSLEWEMKFESWNDKCSTAFQIRIGDGYMFTVGIEDGTMTIGDASSTGTGISTKFDINLDPTEWNKFRVEFYVLDAETRSTAAKIYVNGEPRFVSNNYFGKESALTPTLKYTYARFYGLSSPEFVCYVDNIVARALSTPYAEEELVNPDRIKDFENATPEGELPLGVTTEGGSIVNDGEGNVFVLDGSGKKVFINSTTASGAANCYSLATRMKIEANSAGEIALLALSRDGADKPITAFKVAIYEDGGEKLAKLMEYDRSGKSGSEIGGLPVGEWFTLTVDFYPYFYETGETGIVYLNGTEIGRCKLYYYVGTVAGPYNHFYLETKSDVKISLDNVIPEFVDKKFMGTDGVEKTQPEIQLPESGMSSNTAAKDDHDGIFDFEGYEYGTPRVPGLRTSVNADEYENRIIIAEDPKNAANKVIKHTSAKGASGNASYFTASKASPSDASVYVQSFDLYAESFNGGGIQTSIKGEIGDKEVNMFQTNINISATNGVGTIQIKSKRDATADFAEGEEKNNDTVILQKAAISGWINLRFELYTELGIVKVYLNGDFVGETDVVYTARMSAHYYRANIFTVSNTNCTIYYDNVEVFAVNKEYVSETPVTPGEPEAPETPDTPDTPDNPEDSFDGIYDFEEYQTGTTSVENLTGKFTNGYLMVVEDSRAAAGKVLDYYTYAGANETLTFLPAVNKNAKTLILSFDFKLNTYAKDTTLLQVKLDTSYMFSIGVKSNTLEIKDASTTSGGTSYSKSQALFTVENATSFHSFRIEYAVIDGAAYVSLYADEILRAVSGNYYDQKGENGKPAFNYTKATFSSLSSAEFSMNLDNVSVIQSEKEPVKLDYTHSVHLIGEKFSYTYATDAVDFEDGMVSGDILAAPTIGDANYVSSSVVTDVKNAANKVLRVNIGSAATCGTTGTYSQKVTPKNQDKTKDGEGIYVQSKGAYVFSYDFRYDGASPTEESIVADVIFNHTPNAASGYWNHIIIAITENGELKIKLNGNKSDTPNRDFAKVGPVINDGEWHNIRLIVEKLGADSALSVFLDDVCLIYRVNCYYNEADVNANSYVSSVLWRQRKTSFDFSVDIDNLYFEYAGDYDVSDGLVK